MPATTWIQRAQPWLGAAVLLLPSLASAGVIRGTLEVPTMAAEAKLHPYPGRANSMPMASKARGVVTDAVIYLEKLPASAADLPAKGPEPELGQKDQAFVPRVLAIERGTTVSFPNHDPIFHNVFSVSPNKRFDLGKYPRGQTRHVRFDKPGLVNVYCDIHSDMAAYILVLPNHAFTQPAADGSFALPDLPAGSYSIKVWHPDFGELHRDVEIPGHGDVTADFRY
jgi:plastocyanin